MALSLQRKKEVVAEVAEAAGDALSAVAAEYRGLTVSQMTELRSRARNDGVFLKVVKNTLFKRAVEGTEFECMREGAAGPLLYAFSKEDPGAAARLLKDFAKQHKALEVKLIALNGQLLPASDLERLASLPTRDEALAQLMGVMRAPIEKLVRTMNEPHAKLARCLAAVRDQKEAA